MPRKAADVVALARARQRSGRVPARATARQGADRLRTPTRTRSVPGSGHYHNSRPCFEVTGRLRCDLAGPARQFRIRQSPQTACVPSV